MKKCFISSLRFLTGLGLSVLATSQLHAALLYWDPQAANAQNPYTGNMTGTWENPSWSSSSSGQATTVNWTNGVAACFGVNTGIGTPPFTILMNANHIVNGMFIGSLNPNSCNITIYGPGIITVTNLQGFNIHNASDGSLGILTISNTIADGPVFKGIFNPQNNGAIYLYGSNTWAGGTSLGYSGASWNGTVYFDTTNAFGTGTIYTSNCLGGALVMNGTSALTVTNPLFFPTPTSGTLNLVGGSLGLTLSGPVTVNQSTTLGIGSVNGPNVLNFSGVMSGAGALTVTNTTANTATLTLAAPETYTGNLTIGSGDVVLAATGSFVNNATITVGAAGTFDPSAYSPFALTAKQTLEGSGTVLDDVSVGATAKIAGGTPSAIGTLNNTGSVLLQSGGTNIVYIQNALTGAGVGNSEISPTNNIGVLATSANPFTIKLVSITGTGAAGPVTNFDRTAAYSWTIATATLGDVTNFDASDFVVDASAFANLNFGQFSVSSTANTLVLNYTPLANPVIGSQFPSNNITLYEGQLLAPFSVTAGGQGPLFYQWFTNGVADTTLGTNPTYPMGYVQLSQSGTYQCVVTNDNSSVTNELITLTVLPWTALYSSNLMTLEPVGYWPMHETESAARGDIETNYGTLGALANGYYPDWIGAVKSIQRGAKGAIVGDTDTAVYFTNSTSGITNALYVPHTSPLTTLSPPFSVECWFYPTNTGANDIWSQCGFEGLNAGASGAGNGKVCGIRLYAGGNGVTIYSYNNSSALESPVSCTNQSTGSWVHIVVTCDATTNFSLYTNGVLAGNSSGPVPTLYAPDYWTPFEVGNGRGNTRACAGIVDEVAIYTNVLQPGDISAHYTDGLGGVAGQYFADVIASNPAVYLRMDAPAYTAPAASTWPILTNYGSAGVNGVYNPGTVPGVLAGPNVSGFSYAGFTNVNVALFSGVSSFADAGNSSAYNPTGANANFTVSAMFKSNPSDNRVQSIVGHGTNSWELDMSTNGCLVFNAGNTTNISNYIANQPASGSAAGDVKTVGVYNDGKWHQVVAVNQINRVSIYVDGVLDTNGTASFTPSTNAIRGNTADLMIGADPSFTNNPVGEGRQFAGQICDVAFYNSALTAADVQGLYDATGPPGSRFTNLSPVTAAYGTATATFSGTVSAAGPDYPPQGETVTVAIPNAGTNSTTIDDSTGDFTLTVPINTVPAGTYVITYSYPGNTIPPETDSSTKLTITKAPVTVTANGQTKTYGQTITFGAGSTQFTSSGLQNADTIGTVTLAVSGTPAGGVSNAPVSGSPYTITPSAATGGTFTAGNYTITYATNELTVNPLPVALTGTRPYDGTATADFSILSITNIVGTDDVILVSGSATLASSAQGSEPITSAAGLTLGGAQAGNYTTAGATGAVTVTVNTNPPNIVFSAANGVLTLSWPADHTGWTLQAQTNNLTVGISTNWVDVPGSTTTDQIAIPIDPNNPCVFYRLVYTP